MGSDFEKALHDVPELLFALRAALAVFVSGVPIYAGLRYFMHRRRLTPSWAFLISYIGVFVLYAGLAFIYASPLARYVPTWAVRPYLLITALLSAYAALELIDLFFIRHYLGAVCRVYISPPVRLASKIVIFGIFLLPILRYTLAFNPLTLVAIPTVLTAAVALAMQDTLKSFAAGIGLGKIMHIGEWISVQNYTGKVVDMSLSRTVLETAEGNRVFIPNSQLQNQIVLNYTTGNPVTQALFRVGVSYEMPPTKVKDVILRSLEGVPGLASTPVPYANVLEYGDVAIQYAVYFWVLDYNEIGNIKDEVASRLWLAFRKEGIEIPYLTRAVHLQTPGPRA